ncbi:MAG: CDP-diacylglycerol--glycerol-3-phosphate 3-phosphatidyltransferase [Christensenellales bacterium]
MNLPTKITVARLILIPIFILSYCLQSVWKYAFIFTWLIFMVASLTDYVDGHLARKYNLVTNLGKFLDPIADKVLVVAGLFVIVEGGYLPIPYLAMICAVLIMARELIIGLFRQMAALRNFVLAADKLGKIKTASTMLSMAFILFAPPAMQVEYVVFKVFAWIGTVIFVFATVMTIVSGLNYILKNKAILAETKE